MFGNIASEAQKSVVETDFSANRYIAQVTNKKSVFNFWVSLDPVKKMFLQKKFNQQDIFQMAEKSFFAVEVRKSDSELPEGLFFYGLQSSMPTEKWELPIPIHEFDFCGSLFLQVRF